ncbi:MAG: hypothetical protein AAF411_29445 [Myxococcota bacterium]
MSRPGEARCGVGKALLATFQRLHPTRVSALSAELSDETRASFEGRSALRWIPMAHHMELSDAIRRALGLGEPNIEFWQQGWLSAMDRPFLVGIARAALRLDSAPTRSLLRHAPLTTRQAFRNIGTMETRLLPEDEPGLGFWTVRGFPSRHYTMDCFIEGCRGGLQGAAILARQRVRTTLTYVDHNAGDFEIRIDLE